VTGRLAWVAAWTLLLGTATTGCGMLRGRSIGPQLELPAPPARSLPIASQPINPVPTTVDDVPSREPPPIDPTTPTTQQPPRVVTEPPPVRTEAPADAGAAAPAPTPAPAPPPALQTTANPTEAEQRTRAALENAKRDLSRIDVRRLNAEARSQYDIARRFVQQAEDALRTRNPVFAAQLADKAAQIAALLQKP
jgi:hypothetical protein